MYINQWFGNDIETFTSYIGRHGNDIFKIYSDIGRIEFDK